MPGPTETNFFHRAGMDDTNVGQQEKDDPADVARTGWDALMSGKADVVHGLMNKMQAAASHILPEKVTAQIHRVIPLPKRGWRIGYAKRAARPRVFNEISHTLGQSL